jgi:prolipoprotein diacylglyceryltransferase
VPAHPAQLYEAGAAVVVLLAILVALAAGGFGRRDGRVFLVALVLWAVARAVTAVAWRDAAVLGPLNAGQLLALAVAVGAALLATLPPRRSRPAGASESGPSWPDPASRPQF